MSHSHHGIPNSYKDFYLEVSLGNIPGHSITHKFGRNDSILNNIWDLVSPTGLSGAFPASGCLVRIKAGGNGADTIDGAGAREVTIIGIDTNLNEISETIVTAGVIASAYTTASFWRVYRAYVSSVGTYTGNNIADITLENGNDIAIILAGEGQTQHAGFSIPSSKTGYLLNLMITADAAKAADFRLFTRENFTNTTVPMSPKRIRLYFDGILGHMGIYPHSPMLTLPALSDIWFEAKGAGRISEVSVDFDVLIVEDDPGHLINM